MRDQPTVPRVLVDTCAREHSVLLKRGLAIRQSAQWGPHLVTHDVPYMQRRELQSSETWLREEMKHLAAITAAIAAGRIEAFTSQELNIEGPDRQTWADGSRADLWRGVTFKHAHPPLDRSTWTGGLTLEKLFSGDHQQGFCKLLLDIERKGISTAWLEALGLDDLQRKNLAHLSEFRRLCDAVGEPRWRDAFHLWTAVRNGLDYFLTTDKQFLEVLRAECVRLGVDFELYRPAMSPSELVEILDLRAVALPFQEGEFVPLFEVLRD